MKQLIYSLLLTLLVWSCGQHTEGNESKTSFGSAITDSIGLNVGEALNNFDSGKVTAVVLKGRIHQVCQSEGCWFNLVIDENRRLFVDFNEAFTVSKDIAGKEALVAGSFYRDTISVEQLREQARAAGTDEAGIQAINAPATEVNFRATGVRILQ